VSKRLLLLPCLLILGGLMLAACGGGGGDETSKVEETIETAATTTDPAECSRTQTQKFMEQTSDESGQAALKGCEEEAENEEGAKSVNVFNVAVSGSSATAEAALSGGSLDGQTLEVALVKEGDRWKLNEVVKFTDFDQEKLVETFEREIKREIEESPGKASSKFAGCFIEAIKQADQAEIEGLILSGSSKGLEGAVKRCS
jgi:ABC-type glycerol-3-phosphate transport system substrate-binding protein